MTGSVNAGIISAVVLSLCQYHLDDIYIRSAVGEYTAFIFIPIAVYGIYNLVYEELSKPILLILGYAGVLLCHTSSFVMCILFGVAAVLLNFKKLINNRKVIVRFLIAAAAAMLLTSFYWIPMLEQFANTSFHVSIPWMQPKDEAVNFFHIFSSSFPSVGCLLFLLCIPRVFINKSRVNTEIVKYVDLLILLGIGFALLSCDILPWERIGKYLSLFAVVFDS